MITVSVSKTALNAAHSPKTVIMGFFRITTPALGTCLRRHYPGSASPSHVSTAGHVWPNGAGRLTALGYPAAIGGLQFQALRKSCVLRERDRTAL